MGIYEQNMVFFGAALFATVYFMLENLEKLLQMSLSIANRATMREMADLWMHPHLFKVERDDSVDELQRVR